MGLRLAVVDGDERPYPARPLPWINATDSRGALLPAHLDVRWARMAPLRTFLRSMGHAPLLGPDNVWIYYRRPPE